MKWRDEDIDETKRCASMGQHVGKTMRCTQLMNHIGMHSVRMVADVTHEDETVSEAARVRTLWRWMDGGAAQEFTPGTELKALEKRVEGK